MSKLHLAIIMDGNGRWALRNGLPRTAGHVEGARVVSPIVEACAKAGIGTLTLYAFSSDNWGRPGAEVQALMRLLARYLAGETRHCLEQSIRLNVIGRRDRLSPALLRAVEEAERMTAHGARLHLRLAVDYSAQHTILQAARRAAALPNASERDFQKLIAQAEHSTAVCGPVDLLIRTGGEQRLSDFMLWECAYAELYFTDCLWPEFSVGELEAALGDFARRQRRFGQVVA